ncbi:hypothetical protein ACFLWS_03955 [Chloroflexota bacterium]
MAKVTIDIDYATVAVRRGIVGVEAYSLVVVLYSPLDFLLSSCGCCLGCLRSFYLRAFGEPGGHPRGGQRISAGTDQRGEVHAHASPGASATEDRDAGALARVLDGYASGDSSEDGHR